MRLPSPCLGGIAYFGKRQASERELPLLQLAVVALNLLALIALTWEASDYFDRQLALPGNYAAHFHQVSLVQGFTYSAIWMIYGAILMAVGFRTRSAFVRWQALILIAFTTAKVFLYDVSQLGGSYRILSFIALGAILLGISFIYQRDWLKLSPRSTADRRKGNAVIKKIGALRGRLPVRRARGLLFQIPPSLRTDHLHRPALHRRRRNILAPRPPGPVRYPHVRRRKRNPLSTHHRIRRR